MTSSGNDLPVAARHHPLLRRTTSKSDLCPGRHWLGRTFERPHPSLSPLLILQDHPAFSQPQPRFPESRPEDSQDSPSQGRAKAWVLGQAGLASPLLRIPTPSKGRGKRGLAHRGVPSARALVAGAGASPVGVFLGVFLHLPLSKGSRNLGLTQIPPPSFSAPTCPTGSRWGPCLPSSSWPLTPTHPHPRWQGQGPQGDRLCNLGATKSVGV